MPFRKLLKIFLASLLLVSCAKKGQNQLTVSGGDSEPIHGGDTVDLRVASVRNKTVIALNQMKAGTIGVTLAVKPANCSKYEAPQFCDAMDLSSAARDELRGMISRNFDALISVNAGASMIPVVVTNELGSFTTPSGEKRSVLAWVANNSKGQKIIKLNIGARDISDAQLLALLFHEALHLVTDSKLGHVLTDDEGVAGFDNTAGGGRRLADTAGAAMALLIYPPEQPTPTPTPAPQGMTAPKSTAQFNLNGNQILDGQIIFGEMDGNETRDALFIDRDNSVWVSLGSINGYSAPTKWAQHAGTFQRKQWQTMDLTSDGKVDLIFQNDNGNIELYRSLGTSLAAPVVVANVGAPFKAGQLQFGDVNGDGKKDLIFQNSLNEVYVSLNNGTSFSAFALWVKHGPAFYEYTAFYADFDGNGKVDMLLQQATINNFWLTPSDGTRFSPSAILSGSLSGDWSLGRTLVGDMNGDGKADVAFVDANNVIWMGISNGTTFAFQPVLVINGVFVPGRLYMADMNGDGKGDLLYQKEDSSYHVALSTGTRLQDWKPMAQAGYAVNAGAFSPVKFSSVVPRGLCYVDQLGKIWLSTPQP